MKAVVVNFRGPYKQQKASNQIVIKVSGVETRDAAAKLVNKEVVWSSPKGLAIKGKIAAAHGNKGAVRAIFEKGIPGQALSTEVKIE
ncbi:MAG TPA: 50S ribosomal protein L35ae [Candidatus Nanoarchaeia archaeon]|nr:50S ribosomal protein L35ae [Candidatus Nanoarchaeia archaeon]